RLYNYCDLISCLLVAEQNNKLLLKNHESRPTGPTPLSEANVVTYNQNRGHGRGSDRDEDVAVDVVAVVAKGVDLAKQDEKIDNFDTDSFDIDSLDVDPKDQNDTIHVDVSDFLTNE
nr:hypothetical protein [Tanacetum cinerariifolium]